ncbi:FAD-dependent oxidoreductase [Desulfuromonas acetoxidans]|uniref:Pyridine nucleotide-disulphide oxidoreductase dimerisation region n=1 Tax=Desulfuromonas acetoxidans (strain DSM 684 / 11070) TaxID=281689 RepID=Q1K470_DESA6|nr:FAD-dependent oxidoreductase [Desulfuromonas acetoxidans]EAT17233.1 pyridine nucleotide-disulphide oxidoreductase dimerisation region [Desulfuromonas acetoxidans DSM 684]MBF0645881.1 FAD-dependent oxidoreductase [Desulfuromonas acetoxidans]NVD24177.1 FAD-dependent oxidoreductase [Desulfuromonas acetoxidans]NVE15050.1 FAD-dependent oxidoreductase [Desulfuromonas acetoxidans]
MKMAELMQHWLPQRYDYNLVVVGAGAAGLVSAYLSAAAGARVALVEQAQMGGDCLNRGCVPSKALIRSAHLAQQMRQADHYGLPGQDVDVDFAQVMERVQQTIRTIEPHDSVERYQSLGVECFHGQAHLLSGHEVAVGDRVLTTRRIVLATGATPVVPELAGLDSVDYYTSDTIWSLRQKPRRLIVVGGGPIGCELSQAFNRLGSQVVQVVHGERLLKREDRAVCELVQQVFHDEGVELCLNCDLQHVARQQDEIVLTCHVGDEERTVHGDALLFAVGRQPMTQGFGFEVLGGTVDRRGALQADGTLRTSVPSIYCAGDVVGPYQFTHMAAHQAATASLNALFDRIWRRRVDVSLVPWTTFVDPEVARVGLNEQDALRQKIAYEVTRLDYGELDRAVTDTTTPGWIQVLTVPGKDTILGVTIVGAHAGDCLAEFVLAMKNGLGLKKILATIHVYPTLAEGNKLVAGEWQRRHFPAALKPWLKRFHDWMRRVS